MNFYVHIMQYIYICIYVLSICHIANCLFASTCFPFTPSISKWAGNLGFRGFLILCKSGGAWVCLGEISFIDTDSWPLMFHLATKAFDKPRYHNGLQKRICCVFLFFDLFQAEPMTDALHQLFSIHMCFPLQTFICRF